MLKINTPFDFMCVAVGAGALLVGVATVAALAPGLGLILALIGFVVIVAWALVRTTRRFGGKLVATAAAALAIIAGGFFLNQYLEEQARVTEISRQAVSTKPANVFDQFDPPGVPAKVDKGVGMFDDLIPKAPAGRGK